MTPDGLEPVEQFDQQELRKGRFKFKIKDAEVDIEAKGTLIMIRSTAIKKKKMNSGEKSDRLASVKSVVTRRMKIQQKRRLCQILKKFLQN